MLIISALLLLSKSSFSQNIKIDFVKQSIKQDAGSIVFNVAKIYNFDNEPIKIKPVLLLPKGWAVFSTAIKDTSILGNDSISIPFRIRIPQNADSDISHKVYFQFFSQQNKLLLQENFNVNTNPYHDWDIKVPKKRVYFAPGNNKSEFEINFSNNGNTTDTISLNVILDKKIQLSQFSGLEMPKEIILRPGIDTTIKLQAEYINTQERIFDLSKVQIHASSSESRIYRAVIIEKYSDSYSPFEIDNTLPHQAEFGIRTFNNNNEVLPFIKTMGSTTFKNQSNFRYNFTYYDLTKSENIIANSYYNFLYTQNDFKAGLGAFSSMLGRNLYNRNSIMISNRIRISKSSSLEGFASYGFIDPKTSAAFGYIYDTEKLHMNSSISYDFDQYKKINTASFLFHSNQIRLAKGHEVSANIYAYHESHYLNNKYTLAGVAWDLNYYGRISKDITLQISNNYGSPDIPGPQMGLLNFVAKLNLYTYKDKHFYTFKYINTSKDYYYVNYEGIKLPNIQLNDQYFRILYHSNTSKFHRWSAGPSIEVYSSQKPIPNSDEKEIYSVRKYRMEYRSFIGTKLILTLKAGIGDFYYKVNQEINKQRYDFHLLGDYNLGGYGIRFAYDYGPMVNTGIYQFAMDASNNSVNISPYALKQFFKDRLRISLFANIAYRFDMKYGTANINPKIEAYIFKDWWLMLSGTYSYVNQEYKGGTIDANYFYSEISIKKKWGKSDYKKWQKDLRRIKIVFFKDNNGNGVKDNFEEGIPHVKARLLLINTANQKLDSKLPTDLTLLSNDEGNVIFSRIPMGFYELSITPLTDQKEYFYINKSVEKIEITKTQVYYVPFQKASKIEGQIDVARRKYTAEGEYKSDLANIKVTAISTQGNSYSAFTSKDGSFVIYAPGNNTYFLRISNVFGKEFRILQNDIKVQLPEPDYIIFKVVENNRKIKFKKAKPQQEGGSPQKIKVLPGKIYENDQQRLSEQNPLPEFNIKNKPAETQIIQKGLYYVVVQYITSYGLAIDYIKILKENGVIGTIGIEQGSENIIIFTNYYSSKEEAKEEIRKLKTSGIKEVEIYSPK